jgi:hypothetical protein
VLNNLGKGREVFLAKNDVFFKNDFEIFEKRFDHTFVFFFWKLFLKKRHFWPKKPPSLS